jgi:hypothetical protein
MAMDFDNHSEYYEYPHLKFRKLCTGKRMEIDELLLLPLLVEAHGLVGVLNGMSRCIGNINRYTEVFMMKEVCASCRMADTQITFFELMRLCDNNEDAACLQMRLLDAMKYAWEQSANFDIKRIHSILVGGKPNKSEFRNDKVSSINDFNLNLYTPIMAGYVEKAMADIDIFMSGEYEEDTIIKAALLQYQLEIVSPFEMHSRILARMIPMVVLKRNNLLTHPVLWISDFMADFKVAYEDRIEVSYKLDDTRVWIMYFLKVLNGSARKTIHQIEHLEESRQKHINIIASLGTNHRTIHMIYNFVANAIFVNVRQISSALEISYNTVAKAINIFNELGIIRQVNQGERYRTFGYCPILDLFSDGEITA